jgi:hypothetical protein
MFIMSYRFPLELLWSYSGVTLELLWSNYAEWNEFDQQEPERIEDICDRGAVMKEQGRTIRLERQENPNKSFVDAIEEKLQNGSSILKNEGTLAGDSSSCFVRDDSDSGDGD